jgi:hypothetical protein
MDESTISPSRSGRTLARIMPLAGVCFALFEAAGDLTIGPFPNGTNTTSDLTVYYAGHHASVGLGGTLMSVAGVFLALFGAAIWTRLRDAHAHSVISGIVLVGTALAATGEINSGATYAMLGKIGNDSTVDPAALQAWHIATGFGVGGGATVLLVGIFAGGLSGAMPAWLGVIGLILGIAQMTPFGFLAGLLFLPWAAVAGIVMAVRPVRPRAGLPSVEALPATA